MNDILIELKKTNRKLLLKQPKKQGFQVKPKLDNDILRKKLGLNQHRILKLLVDSDLLITSLETWAHNDITRWEAAHSKFIYKYVKSVQPYIQDAYDDLISWINANQRILSNRRKAKKLIERKNSFGANKVAINFHLTSVNAYKRISKQRRQQLLFNLLLHEELYIRIEQYIEKINKREKKDE